MSYEPLHHKYRPKSFAELVGQEAIASTLTNAIRTAKIAPAYLFTGPRGTGKTSSARILAKSLNCLNSDKPTAEPCGICDVCKGITKGYSLDVIEIDAASNTGVDNIRELIEKAQFAPVQCRYKVYVIDECLTGDSLVLTSEGLVRIDDPNIKGKKVLSYNDANGKWEFQKVVRWLDQGERQTLVIKTTNREIRCTGNHLIRTVEGWIPAKHLKKGAKILSPASVDAAPSFTNLPRMDISGDLSEDTSSKTIHTGKNHTIWNPFLNKLNFCDLSVLADVEKSLMFQPFCEKKAKDLSPYNLTGKNIHIKKDTEFGNLEQKISLPKPRFCHQKYWDLSMELCWEMGSITYPNKHSRFPRLCWTHAETQQEWLEYKALRLQKLRPKLRFAANKGYGNTSLTCKTFCHPQLKDVFDIVKPNGDKKLVSMDWLSKITEEGLAWWFFDDGSLSLSPQGSPQIQLHTEGFSGEENQIIVRWLTKMGYPTKTKFYTGSSTGKTYHYIWMGANTSRKWLADLKKYSIPAMDYKFGNGRICPPRWS